MEAVYVLLYYITNIKSPNPLFIFSVIKNNNRNMQLFAINPSRYLSLVSRFPSKNATNAHKHAVTRALRACRFTRKRVPALHCRACASRNSCSRGGPRREERCLGVSRTRTYNRIRSPRFYQASMALRATPKIQPPPGFAWPPGPQTTCLTDGPRLGSPRWRAPKPLEAAHQLCCVGCRERARESSSGRLVAWHGRLRFRMHVLGPALRAPLLMRDALGWERGARDKDETPLSAMPEMMHGWRRLRIMSRKGAAISLCLV